MAMKLGDVQNNTDKGYLHGYLRFYDQLLHDLHPGRVLEVGVYGGHSLELWSRFWPIAQVHGIDIDGSLYTGTGRVTTHVGDAYTPSMLNSLGGRFDFILDDGPHTLDSQLWFARHYPAVLARRGVLCIEDVASPDHFRPLIDALPVDLRQYAYGVDLRATAPDQSWDNHLILVVDTRR